MEYKKHVLENGLRVIFVPMRDTQTVTTQILVEAGSKYENKLNNGISHFLEHMMFKGTKNRPTTKIITELLDNVGGEYNAFTGKEQTGYWIKVPTKHFGKALDVISDIYLNSLLSQDEIDRERGVILQEAAMYRDTPMRYVWDVFEELLYSDQPAGWNIIGSEKNIETFNRKKFVDYMKRMYIPRATVITIAGNFDEEKALARVKQYFNSKKKSRKKISKRKTIEKQTKPAVKLYGKDTDQTHLIVGLRGPHMFSPDRYKAVLLGTILGGGMSSRAFINIRERYGLTYYINAAMDMATDTGYLFFAAGVEHKNLQKAIKLILNELEKIRDKKVSKKELRKAKEYLKGRMLMSLESTSAVATFFGDQELFRKEIRTPQQLFEKIDGISAEDIQHVAKKIIRNGGLNVAVVGPHKDKQAIENMLCLK
ncbi:MAG: pitrilysin family protein [Patescibacteria group bacterium]|nr:pitrilysin family protein [Patescibacteria group bacterium]